MQPFLKLAALAPFDEWRTWYGAKTRASDRRGLRLWPASRQQQRNQLQGNDMLLNATTKILVVAGLSISSLLLSAQQPAPISSSQPQIGLATPQKLPANAKVHPMTADEMRKFATEERAKSRAKAGPRITSPKFGLRGLPLSTVTTLNNQKAFAVSHPAAIGTQRTLGYNSPPVHGNDPALAGRYEATHVNQDQVAGHDPKAMAQRPIAFAYVCTSPLITDVNGQSHNAVFTPETEYNAYIIKGCFFGTQTGQVYWVGKFNPPTINLQIQYWNDGEIDARVDPKLTGELNQDNVSLVVAPVNKPQLKATGFKFAAARSDPAVLLPSIPPFWVMLSKLSAENGAKPNLRYFSPVTPNDYVAQDAVGTSVYVERDLNQKFLTGIDSYENFNLAHGWDLDSVQWFTYDAPPLCPGIITYNQTFGSMQTAWTDCGFVVHGADTSCSGFVPLLPPIVSAYQNNTGSAYALNIWARGPRCTDPFTGKPVQTYPEREHMWQRNLRQLTSPGEEAMQRRVRKGKEADV
jgi:hypothetical protein